MQGPGRVSGHLGANSKTVWGVQISEMYQARIFFMAAGRRPAFVIMSRSLSVCLCIYLSIYVVSSIRPLIGPMWECYIVNEVIEIDEVDRGKIFAAAGKQDK